MEEAKASGCTALTRVEGQLAEWRRCHGKAEKLPETLWEEIAGVAREVGVNRTSRALGLWYYAVKRRVFGSEKPRQTRRAFVQVEVCSSSADAGCVIEMARADGARVTIREATTEQVAVVASSFLGGRR
ncbi:MAG: hypothetical protein WC869_16825 [Phycisphaerae bacterium]|jgi:hypothetical protein